MLTQDADLAETLLVLNQAFMQRFPADVARHIESMPVEQAASFLCRHPASLTTPAIERLAPGAMTRLFEWLPDVHAIEIFRLMSLSTVTALLAQMSEKRLERVFSGMDEAFVSDLKEMLAYPEDSAGRMMETNTIAFVETMSVEQALAELRERPLEALTHLFLVDGEARLSAQVNLQRLVLARGGESLVKLSEPVSAYVQALDPHDDVIDILKKQPHLVLPVVDINHRLVGVIDGQGLIDTLQNDITADMQKMVGVSKDERALSSSLFAVKKRLPWLQINLLTAFLAAGVVGAFEDTIAQFTVLAVLLPIAAGQSGNAGAQALAVTMRGLTLREITTRHWLRVMMKECGTGLLNGLGIAITCSAGVFVWSGSSGLALVMALAMIISMTIAGMSGAVVPMVLKRLGLDPAQSSSIVLTTVTDIAGFLSFLGIAALLSGMLVAG